MNKNSNNKKMVTLGGSVETALSGKYEMNINSVLQEGWKCTTRHFFSFLPSIITLIAVWTVSFYIALTLQLGDPLAVLEEVRAQEPMSEAFFEAVINTGFAQASFIAFFSCQVISAPIYAGVAMMAMSHTARVATRPIYIMKGFSFSLSVTIAVFIILLFQGANWLLPFMGTYFTVAFSNAILLICEKRILPIRSLVLSFKAVNKKLLPILALHLILGTLILISVFYYGIFLIITLPLFFHVKGIIYRNMFGVLLEVTLSDDYSDDDHHDSDKKTETNRDDSQTNKGSKDIFNA